ncbi:MAG: hypothetical protein K2K16_10315 [Ruminococcus sp.]|nr:hypothetical protein [Ruminococcus sp.]
MKIPVKSIPPFRTNYNALFRRFSFSRSNYTTPCPKTSQNALQTLSEAYYVLKFISR